MVRPVMARMVIVGCSKCSLRHALVDAKDIKNCQCGASKSDLKNIWRESLDLAREPVSRGPAPESKELWQPFTLWISSIATSDDGVCVTMIIDLV